MADITINNLPDLSITGTNYLVHTNDTTTGRATVNQLKIALAVPAAQVQSDWNAASGVASILNKPSQQLAQAWVNFNGTNSINTNCTINRQYNVSSVLKENADRYKINFTNPLATSNYVVLGSGRFKNDVNHDNAPTFGVWRGTDALSTTYVRIICKWDGGSADKPNIYACIFC
jgi:hypothetical protein